MCHLSILREFVSYRLYLGSYPNSNYVNLTFMLVVLEGRYIKLNLYPLIMVYNKILVKCYIKVKQNKVLMFKKVYE